MLANSMFICNCFLPLGANAAAAAAGRGDAYSTSDQHACLPILCSSAIASFLLVPILLLLLLMVVGMLIARLPSTSLPMLANSMFFCNCFLPLVANDAAAAAAAGRGDAYSASDQHACLPILCSSAIASFLLVPILLLLLLLVVGMLIARLTSMHACQFYVLLQLLPSPCCQCCCCCCWSWGCL